MKQKTLDCHFNIKSVDERGYIEGYGSVFDVKDSDEEIIAPGAFMETLEWYRDQAMPVPMLWMHQAREPLGLWEEFREDTYGLYVRGKMLIDKVQAASEIHALAMERAISGLSIGFRTLRSVLDRTRQATVIQKLRLWEVSLVTFPANDAARVTAVKSDGILPTEREFEEFLRDAGYSRSQAAGIVAKGYKQVLHGEHAHGQSLAELQRAFEGLKHAVTGKG